MRIGTPESPTPWLTIVGEMADLKLSSPNDPTKEQFFGPVDQAEEEIGSSTAQLRSGAGYRCNRSRHPAWQRRASAACAVARSAASDGSGQG
jgi:hypothetical protein